MIATAGLGGRAAEERWNKFFEEINEFLIFAPSDLAVLGKDQLRIVSDDPDSNRLLGQLWRAAKVASGAKDLAERLRPSSFALQGWNAYWLANAISADSAKDCELAGLPRRMRRPLACRWRDAMRRGRARRSGDLREARLQQGKSPSFHRQELRCTF